VAYPTTSHKVHGGVGFGVLGGAGVVWGASFLVPFFWAFPPY